MKNKFNELKEAVKELNDPIALAIVDLLEDYNLGLSRFFRNREISRDFMNAFDLPMTIRAVNEKFNVDCGSNMALQNLVMDINTLARSTWYFVREDGTILTGDDLYRLKAVYMASYKTTEPVFASEEEKKEHDVLWDYVESRAFFGDVNDIPKPVAYEEVIKDIGGEEKPSTVADMVGLIKLHVLFVGNLLTLS